MNRLELCIDRLENVLRKEKLRYLIAYAGVYLNFTLLDILYRLGFLPDPNYENAMP